MDISWSFMVHKILGTWNFGFVKPTVPPRGGDLLATGFLTLNWNDRSPVGPLARRSFQLHQAIRRKAQGNSRNFGSSQRFSRYGMVWPPTHPCSQRTKRDLVLLLGGNCRYPGLSGTWQERNLQMCLYGYSMATQTG